ncbi:MAG: hypothetical protein SGBAC_006057 [Bacillariaceae sp.]
MYHRDCYMAVCGLPEPCDDHAVVMARFTRDCLEKMTELVHQLESTLGPDTAELVMRAGLHSGPVTAGVLRGDRARFQLFGDTVNTASRMESTGVKAKIHISQETAELITASGKGKWVLPREDTITAKGKGQLKTFWLLPRGAAKSQIASSISGDTDFTSLTGGSEEERFVAALTNQASLKAKTRRLVEFSGDILLQTLNKIATKRGLHAPSTQERSKISKMESKMGKKSIALEEVTEVISLPSFDSAVYNKSATKVPEEVRSFDHASHVTQSVSKLLSRIVAVKQLEDAKELHDHTYGITSDPLTQFAIVFSSLIHDVDHRGVPNALLMKEDPEMASLYKNQAVAEQNSVDVAWNLLMDPRYELLRGAIYCNTDELLRFRQLVVNSLMATDIFDKKLASLRKGRWEKAFTHKMEEHPQIAINRKATIVIEHIIQASDVSHTMQHWHVYSKWNEMLLHEMLKAYCEGRSDTDPSANWYQGELWFFDNYARSVIPLAGKLKECGVFGVSSDEYLQYAVANRREWESKGEIIVKENTEKYLKVLPTRREEGI